MGFSVVEGAAQSNEGQLTISSNGAQERFSDEDMTPPETARTRRDGVSVSRLSCRA